MVLYWMVNQFNQVHSFRAYFAKTCLQDPILNLASNQSFSKRFLAFPVRATCQCHINPFRSILLLHMAVLPDPSSLVHLNFKTDSHFELDTTDDPYEAHF